MIGLADDNGKEYECVYGTYSKKEGFKFNEAIEPIVDDQGWREVVNILVHEDLWRLKKEPVKEMSLEEIEKELGYRVQIVDPQPEKKKVDKEHKERVDDTIQFFKDFFGIDLDPEEYY